MDLRAASRDCWPRGTLLSWHGIDGELPARVYWPRNAAEVLQTLAEAKAAGAPIVPYGAGSGVCGGASALPGAFVLDTKRLGAIGPLDTETHTVWAEAGVNGQQLEDWLNARGFTLGHSPSSIACSTVGGWAAARSAGQFSSKYGVFEDMVLTLEGVSPGGGHFTVGEGGDAPPEWLDWVLGSEGTLAVVTRVRLRVWPTPKARWWRGYRCATIGEALAAMRKLVQGELHPSVVRLYDPVDTRIGGRTRKDKPHSGEASFLRRWLSAVDALPAVRQRTLALPLSLPRLLNRLVDRFADGCLLVVGFEGDAEVVKATAAAGHEILCAHGEDLGSEPGERWFAARHHVSYKLMPVFERGGFADTMEVACRWSDVETTYHAVRRALAPHALTMAHMSHVYPEGACLYFSFAGKGQLSRYDAAWRAAQQAALDSGATVSHHHGIGVQKAENAARELGVGVAVWQQAKATLDPDGLMNPGRLFLPEETPTDAGPPAPLRTEDGLSRQAVGAVALDAAWPFSAPTETPRWHRCPWQTPFVEVSGTMTGVRFVVGRGPRSAVGSDVRLSLCRVPGAEMTVAVPPQGQRYMGFSEVASPFRVALALLRSDLRPAVLTVRDGKLHVGFRGPAAAALYALASARVPGGLTAVPYEPIRLPAGPFRPCEPDDPAAVLVTPQGVYARAS